MAHAGTYPYAETTITSISVAEITFGRIYPIQSHNYLWLGYFHQNHLPQNIFIKHSTHFSIY